MYLNKLGKSNYNHWKTLTLTLDVFKFNPDLAELIDANFNLNIRCI